PHNEASAQPTTDLQSLAARIDDMKPALGRADVAAGLMQAARIFQVDRNPNRELYIVTDRQAISWTGLDEPFASAWCNAVARDGLLPRAFLIPIGGEQSENVAIESIHLPGPPLVRGQAGQIELRVRNFGAQPRAAIGLTITTSNA